jgi:chemosensory pili system protein ChpA (sensor histidine kinase/response regulator)
MTEGRALDHPELLAGFRDEVRGYLPVIRQGIEEFSRLGDRGCLVEPHRLVHTIKGSASLLGLPELAATAALGEVALERLMGSAAAAAAPGRVLTELLPIVERLAAGAGLAMSPFGAVSGLHVPPSGAAAGAAWAAPAADGAEILDGFRQEAAEYVSTAARLLRELERVPGDPAPLTELRRVLHTFKGVAAVVGSARLAGLCHRLEDVAEASLAGPAPVSPVTVDALFAGLAEMEALVLGEPPATTDRSVLPPPRTGNDEEESAAPERPRAVRDDRRRLREVLRLSGELVSNHAAFEERFQGFDRQLQELELAVARLRQVARQIEGATESMALTGVAVAAAARPQPATTGPHAAAFGPQSATAGPQPATAGPQPATAGNGEAALFDALDLERYSGLELLSRSLGENAADLSSIARELAGDLDGAEADRRELKRLTRGLQDQLVRLQLAPLGTLAARLDRTVRTTGAREGKRVDFVLAGEEVELDRAILAGIADPLLHLLRNAVGHGIEPPATRRELGKPERGTVEVRARMEGSQVAIEVADDGAGLDWTAIHAAAAAAGVVAGAHLLFEPGFTTTAAADEISGRGVGLDVVKTEVERLRGSVTVQSHAGAGATFTLRLPQSLALARVVLVRAAGETLAVPAASIAQVLRIPAQDPRIPTPDAVGAAALDPGRVVDAAGESFPVRDLAELLALPPGERSTARRSVLLLAAGERRLALAVDDLAGMFDAVVGGLGTLLPRVRGVSGAAVAGDGRLLLVLNPAELLAVAASAQTAAAQTAPQSTAAPGAVRPAALVVDDSLSVRRVLAGLLRSAGWEVQVARDGREALEILQAAARLPAVAVVDVEMPRMNGYELLASLRREPALHPLPVVFLTSRAGEKHRAGALALGADGYLVKPYEDAHLLATLARVARAEMPHAGA